ncbi:hypothetical protein [Sphingomonas nostoxanthinifaciens]|uniref:hypothetical protein n=1 Tax=Sphingomonas nostoxanthinifaciens TaxID=2872652 RepID=UPI001CC1E75C|nr:hypothetical protein [Sphingomonas nostoxanthinifaciens]UAK24315.1 hypothetical protein K8P63_18705 [Sphingomonas nostoxanthinifaciens]
MIALALAAAAASPTPTVYAITRIGSDLAADQVVGVKRAGMMCMRNGVIRWSDLAAGHAMDQREAVQDALEDADIAVTPLGESAAADSKRVLRLRGVVRAASANLCARHWLGDSKALSGEIGVTIEWRAESRATATVERRHESVITRTIDAQHAAPAAALYRALLGDAARDLARWLSDPASAER